MGEKQSIRFSVLYGYHGAACHDVRVTEEYGWIEARNSYGELMFSGGTTDFFKFMVELSENKLA